MNKTQENILFFPYLFMKLKIKGCPTTRIPNTSTLALNQFYYRQQQMVNIFQCRWLKVEAFV